MSLQRTGGLLLALLAASLPTGAQDADDATGASAALEPELSLPELEPADLDGWRAFVLPLGAELGFDSLDWSADLASGLERSAAEQKPLLLWLMNGHPLGCT